VQGKADIYLFILFIRLTLDRIFGFVAASLIILCFWVFPQLPPDLDYPGAHYLQNGNNNNTDKGSKQGDAPTPTTTLTPAERIATQAPAPPGFNVSSDTFSIPKGIVFDPAGPRPEQFVLLTAADGGGHNGGIENILERALSNRQEYCDYHGFICHWVDTTKYDIYEEKPKWKKLPAIVETFETYPDAQWVWLLDLDALIMTPTVDITEELLGHKRMKEQILTKEHIKDTPWTTPDEVDPKDMDILVAQDQASINSGSILFKRSPGMRALLDMWRDPILYNAAGDGEQKTLVRIASISRFSSCYFSILKIGILTSPVPIGSPRTQSRFCPCSAGHRAPALPPVLRH
jgi:galactosyl transferase GMA12/MNN10 family